MSAETAQTLHEGLTQTRASGGATTDNEFVLGVASSFLGRAWRYRPYDAAAAHALEQAGYGAALARLLAARGVGAESVEDFLVPRLKTLLPDPSMLAHMDEAAARVVTAIECGERIAILGDYDVDGACASALLLRFLRALGSEPLLYIPDRLTEGYGPSPAAMRYLQAQGARVVATVDTGAAAHEALAEARVLGLDVIVLDHHAVETNPPAFAHINPNGPDDASGLHHICGTGVAFLFAVAVQRALRTKGWFAANNRTEPDLLDFIDLVGLATITDVMPLIGVNRAFVRLGLKRLSQLSRPGFAALARVASAEPPFSAYHLGFLFGPRINAGGRVGRCDLGARLLATDDSAEAEILAGELDRHNKERQAIEADILAEAVARAMLQQEQAFIFVTGENWHPGVVGIVASRLVERFRKPAFVAGFAGGDMARGSARSVRGVDLGAVVRAAQQKGLLAAGGGHAMAAGFSLPKGNAEGFLAHLREAFETRRAEISAASELLADTLVSVSGATLALLDGLERAEPYGPSNPEPVFVIADATIAYADRVGTNHVRLRLLAGDGAGLSAIAFRAADSKLGEGLLRARGKRVHLVGKLKRDDFGGIPKVQLVVEDAAAAGV
jgi:single-stranded-DNA-specific exonuclease